jgi:hypothetical protein
MNRKASEIARILEVQPGQVKSWAFTFKDYLGAQANPRKGATRTFSDSDVLVLAYVWWNWETEPDLDAIRAGLNSGEHYGREFCELLYRHTPILQEPPDDLDETWRHGVLLCAHGMTTYLELARNYRHVANDLLRAALKSGEPLDLAYPVLFAYRHTLELYLKIVGEIDENTHSLRTCIDLVEKRHPGNPIDPAIKGWILELDRIDPSGTAFRYADAKLGTPTGSEHWLDFVQFEFAMNQVFEMLDHAVLRLGTQKRPAKPKEHVRPRRKKHGAR